MRLVTEVWGVAIVVGAPVILIGGFMELRETLRMTPRQVKADADAGAERRQEGLLALLMWTGLTSIVAIGLAAARGATNTKDMAATMIIIGLVAERLAYLIRALHVRSLTWLPAVSVLVGSVAAGLAFQ